MADLIEPGEAPLWKSPFFVAKKSPFFVANKVAVFVTESGIPELPLGFKSMIELMIERRERCEEMGVRLSNSWVNNTVYF